MRDQRDVVGRKAVVGVSALVAVATIVAGKPPMWAVPQKLILSPSRPSKKLKRRP